MNGEAMVIQREPIAWKIKKAFRKLLSQVVLWVSVAVIAIIAIPTVVLGLAITGIWQLADHILAKLERRE
ncbi:hypothetical protein [Solibaculum mannosilyticum]|uniref:hypothetical protein n=1 Tax=Solibaculum mannosilyticum TaxID=2780922 RepID=UPI0007A81D0D|nr:hypothetical protein BN3661_01542 [Eubacteriaceae bacterium CHKCI005]